MKVKEIVALAAQTLGRNDLSDKLASLNGAEEQTIEAEAELKSLLRCYNLIENEIALDFFPLKSEEKFVPVQGKIPYSEFSFAPVNIFKATDRAGAPVSFKLMPTYLSVPSDCREITVLYMYSPSAKKLSEESAFGNNISPRLMAFGVASEFCITNRQYAEGAMWGRRYRDALRAAGIYRRTLSVRSRRWI